MQYEQDISMIYPYLLKQVLVTLSDGSTLRGKLTNFLPESNRICLDDSAPISLDTVADIEVYGRVDFHTYADDPKKAFEIEALKLYFGQDDFVPETNLSIFLYNEFSATVACHLSFTESKICVKDVRVLHAFHNYYFPALATMPHIYLFHNKTSLVGTLQNANECFYLCSATGEKTEINFADVVDIIRMPLINEEVEVLCKDGSSFAGTVYATDSNFIVLRSTTPYMVKTADIRTIRYRGVITAGTVKLPNNTIRQIRLSLGVKDEHFLCKTPYLRDPRQDSAAVEGVTATFIPGMTSRGLIAKDVVLAKQVQVAPKEEPQPEGPLQEHYGLILSLDTGGGYIGNRYVHKSCGKPVVGTARFSKELLTFDAYFNQNCVVKYTAVEVPGKKLLHVKSMELVKVVDSSQIGIIEVSDDGEIKTTSLFQAGIDRFAGRDVDLICTNGETVSGILSQYDSNGVIITRGLGETAQQTSVLFDQIEQVYLIGTVTQYYPNGTGYVDNAFFFHINEMSQAIDAQFVRPGTQFIFVLRNARKGNFVDCGDIRILHEQKLDVFVVGYQDKKYTVIDAEKYGKYPNCLQTAYEVPYSSYNQFRDLENEDYHAVLTLARKAGVHECAYIRTFTNQPKLRAGVVTGLSRDRNTVTIVPAEFYRKANRATTYPLAMRSTIPPITNIDQYDYEVLYTLSVQDREYAVSIVMVNRSAHYKCYFGYLETWLPDKEYGFITPEAYYGMRQKPWNIGVYFRQTALVNPPEQLTDTNFVYRVCYTLNIKSIQEKLPAQNVWFLEKIEKTKPAPVETTPVQQAETSKPKPEPVAPVIESSELDLSEAYPEPQVEGISWHYGIVLAYSPRFDAIRIYRDFQNKKLPGADMEFEPRLILCAPVPEEQVTITDESILRLVTAKFAYLVRFAASEEDDTLVFDDSYPLEILREFRKNAVASLCIDGKKLHINTLTSQTPAQPAIPPVAETAEPAIQAQEPAPSPLEVTEDIDLNQAFPPAEAEGVTWYYGIVPAYSTKFDSVRIYKDFQNKKLIGVDPDFEPQLLLNTPIQEENVKIAGDFAKITTSRFFYLVRFSGITAEDGTLSFDSRYPLEFLREFRKTTLRILLVEGDKLHLETGPIPTMAAVQPQREEALPAPVGIAPYQPGETVILSENGELLPGTVQSASENTVVLTDGRQFHPETADVIRFGVLTSFNENMTVGCLNGNQSFNFANMESRTFNMIKTAKKQQLLWYTCQNGAVSHIERITGSFLDKLPFQWVYGTVTDYAESNDKRCILVDGAIRCLLTVATGVYIWGLIKSNSIIGKAVFVKVITCPYTDQNGTQIFQYAMDIHTEQEVSTIRYDAVSDRYLAAQNATQFVVVEGNRNVLSSLVDSQTTVLFRITEDGKKLQAFLDKNESDADWTEEIPEEDLEVSKVLMDSSLVQYLLSRIDLTALQLPDEYPLNAEGQPVDQETAIRLILYMEKRFGKDFNLQKYISVIALLAQLPEDLKEDTLKQLETRAMEAAKQSSRYRQEESMRQIANRYRSAESVLWWMLNRQVRSLSLQNDGLWSEYSYYITTLLRDIHSLDRQKQEIYKLFLQDFYSRIEVMEILRQLTRNQKGRKNIDLQSLFRRNVLADNIGQLMAHIISLDEAAVQHLVITEDVLGQNPELTQQILDWGKTVDTAQNFESAAILIDHLRALYKNDKARYTKELTNAANGLDVLKHAERILKNISGRFLLLVTADDAQRFTELQEICENVLSNSLAGYRGYHAALTNAWGRCSDLLQNAQTQLTQETTEMLLKTGLLEAVLAEIGRELNVLYTNPDYAPNIRCTSNDSEVVPSQKHLILLVENGNPGRTNLQNADNIKLHLEVLSGLPAGSIPEQISLKEKVLPAGAATVVLDKIPIDLSALDGDMFSISVSAEYECCTGFQDKELRTVQTEDCGILEFQLCSDQNVVKNTDAVNYYLHPAEGNPLKETSEDDCRMFFGREEELQNIWDSIVDENQILREGRAIMLYGQKKCGKTSLVNQIVRRMREDEAVSQQAIIISVKDILEFNGGVTSLGDFSLNFYQNILDEFEDAIRKNHRGLLQMLSENDLEIPLLLDNPSIAPSLFQRFFRKFASLDQGQHRIVLVMDEFTRLCTTILSRRHQYPEYQGIPNFIKLFSSMGFVQIIIGHPNMMRALSQLGIINHTAEFAKRIELTALKEEDARALIREPMIRSFGFDVYQTVLGERAIEKLLALSGCHPSVLMKLCDHMFRHYVTTAHSQILIHDVEKMLDAYLPQLEASTTFDIMVVEDGDAAAFFDSLPTYRYLKTVATESLHSNNRDCDINTICQELGEEDSQNVREILIGRRVLEAGNGRIKIPIELFLEYIRYKYETH